MLYRTRNLVVLVIMLPIALFFLVVSWFRSTLPVRSAGCDRALSREVDALARASDAPAGGAGQGGQHQNHREG
jgi:hypothetical protein